MIHAVTFRIEYDGTYEQRYDSLNEAIRAEAQGPGGWWAEPTSFFLIRSALGPVDLANAIVARSSFDERKDLLLVLNVSGSRGHSLKGHYTDRDVLALLGERSK